MTGSILAAANDGKIEAKTVINKELSAIISIDLRSSSEGILLRKYISSGKSFTLNKFVINNLTSSI